MHRHVSKQLILHMSCDLRIPFSSHDSRQEFILLSDVLGVSALVDALNHPKVGNSTQSTVLGPFFTEDAADGYLFLPNPTSSEQLIKHSQCPWGIRSHQRARGNTST
jgi:hypothetical protein